MKTREHSLVHHLEAFKDNRGALATLRRGLGQPPGTVPDMFRYIIPLLPQDAFPGSWTERSYYLIASLYALHPESKATGDLGEHFAENLDPNPDYNAAIERRFVALLTAHPDDLHIYLRQAISFLKSKEEKGRVNWHQLMWDLLQLGNPDSAARVQKRWANHFWRRTATEPRSTTEQPASS
jgi:CRISPR system Cascade subunit CasB